MVHSPLGFEVVRPVSPGRVHKPIQGTASMPLESLVRGKVTLRPRKTLLRLDENDFLALEGVGRARN